MSNVYNVNGVYKSLIKKSVFLSARKNVYTLTVKKIRVYTFFSVHIVHILKIFIKMCTLYEMCTPFLYTFWEVISCQ